MIQNRNKRKSVLQWKKRKRDSNPMYWDTHIVWAWRGGAKEDLAISGAGRQ